MNLTIRRPNNKDLEPDKLNSLTDLINRVYADAEAGMWQPNARRINAGVLKSIISNKALLIAERNDKIIGCIHIDLVDESIAKFGMLVADLECRGQGIGRELVKAAENWAIEQGRKIMRLEILLPKHWQHPSKEFLKTWYTRIGYRLQFKEPFEKNNAEQMPLLATECDFCVFHKCLES